MAINPPAMNAAQLQVAQRYATDLIQLVKIKQWCVETALANGGSVKTAQEIFAFVAGDYQALEARAGDTAPKDGQHEALGASFRTNSGRVDAPLPPAPQLSRDRSA